LVGCNINVRGINSTVDYGLALALARPFDVQELTQLLQRLPLRSSSSPSEGLLDMCRQSSEVGHWTGETVLISSEVDHAVMVTWRSWLRTLAALKKPGQF
jgi:hypothetical protein